MLGANPLGCQPLGGLIRGLIQRLYEFLVPRSISGDSINVNSRITTGLLVPSVLALAFSVESGITTYETVESLIETELRVNSVIKGA